MTPTHVWGVDPGTVNIGVTLLNPAGQPIYVVDATTVTRAKKLRRVITRWGVDPNTPPGDLPTMQSWASVELGAEDDPLPHVIDAIESYPLQDEERAIVELVGGPVSRSLQINSGILQGVLWARTGHRPAEIAAATWRKAVLGIKGGTNAAKAEKLAKEWAAMGVWPTGASGHAAESRFIAKYGHSSIFCLR